MLRAASCRSAEPSAGVHHAVLGSALQVADCDGALLCAGSCDAPLQCANLTQSEAPGQPLPVRMCSVVGLISRTSLWRAPSVLARG